MTVNSAAAGSTPLHALPPELQALLRNAVPAMPAPAATLPAQRLSIGGMDPSTALRQRCSAAVSSEAADDIFAALRARDYNAQGMASAPLHLPLCLHYAF